MQLKDRLQVEIESVAFGGHGVGRADGLVVFVPFTVTGDVVEVEVAERKKKFARGRLLKVIEPSPHRTEPLCRYFGRCGGCSYQHIEYTYQLVMKQKQVNETFSRIGGLSQPQAGEVIASPRPYAYRGKAELHAAKAAAGFKLGFMDVSGGKLVDIESCDIMDETINGQIRETRARGMFRSGGDDLTFWSGPPADRGQAVRRMVKNREWLIPRTGFFQANLYLTDRMVDEVCALAGAKKRESILDACCGSGLFSIFLAPFAGRLRGIEINEESVRYARINAEKQGIRNADFIHGDVEAVLGDMARKGETVDLMILDPPRTGLSPAALAAVSGVKAQEIIYVSCNPATQARDVKTLGEQGYDLQSLQPLDMFPQTEHVETIGLLRRK
ncbi:MAG: class I SAM-dependent RNA methyltransferase [Deltaproteobacteria bacterium]